MKWLFAVMAVVVFAAAPAVAQPQKLTGDQIAGEIWKNRALFQRQQTVLDRQDAEIILLKGEVEKLKAEMAKKPTPAVVDAAQKKADVIAARRKEAAKKRQLLSELLVKVQKAREPEVQKNKAEFERLTKEIAAIDTRLTEMGGTVAGLSEALAAINLGVKGAGDLLATLNDNAKKALVAVVNYQNQLKDLSLQAASLVNRVEKLETAIKKVQRTVGLILAAEFWATRDFSGMNLNSKQARIQMGIDVPLGHSPCSAVPTMSIGKGNNDTMSTGARVLIECGSEHVRFTLGVDTGLSLGSDSYMSVNGLAGVTFAISPLKLYALGGGGEIRSLGSSGMSKTGPLVVVGAALRF